MVAYRAAAGVAGVGTASGLSTDSGLSCVLRGEAREVISTPPAGKPPLFIMLDGTWPEARKMFRKSPYLDHLPVISVDLSRLSAYRLREIHAEGQYCTAEVAIALLDLAGDTEAATSLGEHFTRFKTRYLAGKTQHPGNVTA